MLPFITLLYFIEYPMDTSFRLHSLVGGVTTVQGEEADSLSLACLRQLAVTEPSFTADSADSRCVCTVPEIKRLGERKTKPTNKTLHSQRFWSCLGKDRLQILFSKHLYFFFVVVVYQMTPSPFPFGHTCFLSRLSGGTDTSSGFPKSHELRSPAKWSPSLLFALIQLNRSIPFLS